VAGPYPCVCCGCLTLDEEPPGTYEVCPVCWWEDDVVQGTDVDAAGANHVTLREAQENFVTIGASDPRFVEQVRDPLPEELPRRT